MLAQQVQGRNELRATAELNEPLRQAQLRVEVLLLANRRKDEFLTMLAHDLCGPLAAVRHVVRLWGNQKGEDATSERMQALIERQLGRLTGIVDELQAVSKLDSDTLHLQRERLDLRDVVCRAIETLEWDMQERGHSLAKDLPDVPVWMQGDRGRLEQVFVNLLANAARYTDPGGRVSVSVQVESSVIVVRVQDSGVGIEPAQLPHIFDMDIFEQEAEQEPEQDSAATSRSSSGRSVGLAVVRNLIELHRGSVTAVSAGAGLGSEFTVRLPTG